MKKIPINKNKKMKDFKNSNKIEKTRRWGKRKQRKWKIMLVQKI